jgi:hypothetical protein
MQILDVRMKNRYANENHLKSAHLKFAHLSSAHLHINFHIFITKH